MNEQMLEIDIRGGGQSQKFGGRSAGPIRPCCKAIAAADAEVARSMAVTEPALRACPAGASSLAGRQSESANTGARA